MGHRAQHILVCQHKLFERNPRPRFCGTNVSLWVHFNKWPAKSFCNLERGFPGQWLIPKKQLKRTSRLSLFPWSISSPNKIEVRIRNQCKGKHCPSGWSDMAHMVLTLARMQVRYHTWKQPSVWESWPFCDTHTSRAQACISAKAQESFACQEKTINMHSGDACPSLETKEVN